MSIIIIRDQVLEVYVHLYQLQLGLALLDFIVEMFYNPGNFFSPKAYTVTPEISLCKY